MKRTLYFDWPDIPFLDFPDLPSPGKVLENLLETLATAMRDDGINAIESVIKLLQKPGPIDFTESWLTLAFSNIFGVALVATIFVTTVIVFVKSLSRRADAIERIINAVVHVVKMFFAGYFALAIFAGILWLSSVLTTVFAGVVTIGNTEGSIDSAFSIADIGSLFGALATSGVLMLSGGWLYVQLYGFEYILAPLALMSLVAFALKNMGMWGERLWKLFVSFVFACAFTKPAVVLILGIAAQVVTNAPGMPTAIENIFLIWTVWFCGLVPLLIMILAYVGYTIQVGKSRAEVEGKVQVLSPQQQNAIWGKQLMDHVRENTARSEKGLRSSPDLRPRREHVMRDHVRNTARTGASSKINALTTVGAAKVAAAIGGPAGAVAAVVVTGAGHAVADKADKALSKGGDKR